MGCCHCMNPFRKSEEYAKLIDDTHPKYTNDESGAGGLTTNMVSPRISRALTRDNTYLLQIGLIGDIQIYEKRCWLLRLLDEDQFEIESQTQKEVLRNNQISQCNKNFIIDDKKYCAQIQIINDIDIFIDDEDDDINNNNNNDNTDLLYSITDLKDKSFDINKYNAFLLIYDITNIDSFNKLKEYLNKLKDKILINTDDKNQGSQIFVMGLIPSCDIKHNDNFEEKRKINENDAKELCKQYDINNIQFIGETNAKTGQNVLDLMRTVVKQCIETQQIQT